MKAPLALLLLISLTVFSPFLQEQQTDREFRNFKGRVKTVTVERANVTQADGKPVEAARQMQQVLTFDANGNLLTDKVYQQGQEFDLRTYSSVDGEWVVKHEVLSKSVVSGVGPGRTSNEPQDSRYSAKIKYEYDSRGNRTAIAWVRPDGVAYLKYVYKLEGNQHEVSVYRENGSFSHGWIDTLDDKGNPVETTNVLPGPKRQSETKSKYTYHEFDSQGNWTKRTETRGDTTRISYRTITYH